MTNADKFKNLFGVYATELWSMPEKDFLKWLNSEVMNCSEIPNNSDLISRQATIDALQKCRKHCIDPFDSYHIDIQDAENQLSNLPTIQPEPKEGHWIKHIDPFGGEQYECSECGVLWEFNDGSPEDNEAFYCPKCGSYNGGGRK